MTNVPNFSPEITDHINASMQLHPDASEVEIHNLLDRIGQPDDIAAEALGSPANGVTNLGSDVREIIAVAFLLVGAFLLVVGWIVGLVLLWTSRVWRLRDKLIGTFLLPGGLLPAAILLLRKFHAEQFR